MDHLFQIRASAREADPMLEAYSVLLGAGARDQARPPGDAGHGRDLPQPGVPGQAGHDARRDLRRPGDLRHRRRLERGRARAFGYTFPPVKERMDRLEDALAIAKGMFTGERFSYEGRYSSVDNVLDSPPPVQAGGPKIIVGGGGEQRTLRIAAKYADMTHWFPMGGVPASTRRKCCRLLRRDRPRSDEIERTMGAPVVVAANEADATAFLERIPEERRAVPDRRPAGAVRRRRSSRTSTRGSPASRSTTTSTRRPTRSAQWRNPGAARRLDRGQSPLSCFMRPIASISSQCSTILPSRRRKMWISPIS